MRRVKVRKGSAHAHTDNLFVGEALTCILHVHGMYCTCPTCMMMVLQLQYTNNFDWIYKVSVLTKVQAHSKVIQVHCQVKRVKRVDENDDIITIPAAVTIK